jgi:hypothetical protein
MRSQKTLASRIAALEQARSTGRSACLWDDRNAWRRDAVLKPAKHNILCGRSSSPGEIALLMGTGVAH